MKVIKYRINDLSCANCANKIEDKVNRLDEVANATLNFMTKELKVTVNQTVDLIDLHEKIKGIVQDIEGNIEVHDLTHIIVFSIQGLDCANCAAKIESKLNKTEGILGVRIDFMSQKLKLFISDESLKKKTEKLIQDVIYKIEPGVTIQELESNSQNIEKDETSMLKNYLIFGIGFALFITALLITKGTTIYYMLLILSYFIIGGKVVFKAFRNIFQGKLFDENFLMTIATMGAFIIGEHPEAIAVMIFYQIGEFFQSVAVNRSRRSIKKLMSIRPDVATIKSEVGLIDLRVEEVQTGQIMIIKPGERIPLDGEVITGHSTIDTKVLTGESVPLNVSPGDKVLSGCINLNSLLTARVTKLASESTISKVLELVENAASKKAPTENFITKFARVYTPIVTGLAVLFALVPPLLFENATFEEWIYRALIFLVISCPCALVISIPLGFFGGIGAASKNGILIKGGNYLEALNHVEIAVFDKTGTLTEGTFSVTKVNPVNGMTEDELLEKAAYVESFSNHPIAVSIVKRYGSKINQEFISNVEEKPGYGINAIYNDEKVSIGTARLMEKENIDFQESTDLGSILYMAVNGKYVGNIVVSDQVKKEAKNAIQLLKLLGVKKTVMLTGDKTMVADTIGKELMIDEIYSELLPENKLEIVEELLKHKSKKGKLIFVGDGINDTPVLARADVGIAMGGIGADAAIDIADVVIMNDEISKIGTSIFIAKRTRKIVYQNIYLALGVKLIFLTMGAFGVATMWEAVIADVGVSLLAILNAMRVLKYKYNQTVE